MTFEDTDAKIKWSLLLLGQRWLGALNVSHFSCHLDISTQPFASGFTPFLSFPVTHSSISSSLQFTLDEQHVINSKKQLKVNIQSFPRKSKQRYRTSTSIDVQGTKHEARSRARAYGALLKAFGQRIQA
jgi:hypothetical protein